MYYIMIPAHVDVVGSDITKPFMVAPVVVVLNKGCNSFPQFAQLAVVGSIYFAFHTTLLDAILWAALFK